MADEPRRLAQLEQVVARASHRPARRRFSRGMNLSQRGVVVADEHPHHARDAPTARRRSPWSSGSASPGPSRSAGRPARVTMRRVADVEPVTERTAIEQAMSQWVSAHRPLPDVDAHRFPGRHAVSGGLVTGSSRFMAASLARSRASARRARGRRRPGTGRRSGSVRRISTGCSASATGVPTSASSYGPALAGGVARPGVPGARHDALVVGDRAVLDVHPVAERAARRLVEAGARRLARPAARDPTSSCRGCAGRGCAMLAASWSSQPRHASRRAPASRWRAPPTRPSVEKSASGPTPSFPSTSADELLHARVARGVGDQHARQRPDLHRQAVVARRLEPGVLAVGVELLVGRLRPGVVRLRLALERVQRPGRRPRVVVPGVLDVLGDLRGVEGARPSRGRCRG